MKNKENLDWWNSEKNKQTIDFPVSVVYDGKWWVATCNDETRKLLGDRLYGCGQGKTKEEAINDMFLSIRMIHDYSEDSRLNYLRFVPFIKGDWKHTGGKWFIIFGILFYFRYGKGMKGGRYLPFTKLNISIVNEWSTYKTFKKGND